MAVTWALVAGCGFSASSMPSDNPMIDASDGAEGTPMPGDMDGDTIADAVDNCPAKPNTSQDDEDGDKKGDVCDPCPHLTGANDLDTDNDGVGNGCDPRPTMSGDALAYWNGFNAPGDGLPPGITTLHGGTDRWATNSSGELVYTANSDDWGMVMVESMVEHHTIDAQFTITSTRSGTAQAAGVAVDIASDDTDLFECQSRLDSGVSGTRDMYRRDPQATDGWTVVQSTGATTPMDTYRIVLQRTASDSFCTNTRLNQASVSLSSTTNTLHNTRAGLFARNVEVHFKYIAVYRSP